MMIKVEIVKSTPEHIDDIMLIERLSFKIPWSKESLVEEITNNKLAYYLSAKVGSRILGYAGIWFVCDEGHITNVAVHPEFRNIGVGSHLVSGLIDIAKQKKITSLTLEVRKSNLVAQALYKKYGFQELGFRKAYYEDNGEDAIIMWKYNI